jgi:hypothetical protein
VSLPYYIALVGGLAWKALFCLGCVLLSRSHGTRWMLIGAAAALAAMMGEIGGSIVAHVSLGHRDPLFDRPPGWAYRWLDITGWMIQGGVIVIGAVLLRFASGMPRIRAGESGGNHGVCVH